MPNNRQNTVDKKWLPLVFSTPVKLQTNNNRFIPDSKYGIFQYAKKEEKIFS